jgi:glycosyltransferase involved in cell wall biosynthesis
MSTIFVSIASYVDAECEFTIRDLFEKAKYPENITVGICWQYHPDSQAGMCPVPTAHQHRVRQYAFHYLESKGAGWARSFAQKLYDGEDFILQIDAHMRFMPDWDEVLITQYQQAPKKPCVMTAICADYAPNKPVNISAPPFHRIYVSNKRIVDFPQIVHLGAYRLYTVPTRPFLSGSIVFNFVFAEARAFLEVPIDPYIYFKGAETSQAARFWTHGYNIYQPNVPIAFHRWFTPPSPYKTQTNDAILRTTKRIQHLLNIQLSDDQTALQEIGCYGLGAIRELTEYWDFLGIDWSMKKTLEHARKGTWDKDIFN